MSYLAGLIPVTQKAVNVCAYCRVRKQGCDRALPRCQRCAARGRPCDYTPFEKPPPPGEPDPEPLVLQHETCAHSDLSPRGTTELLRAVTACINGPVPAAVSKLSETVHDILELADVDLPQALEEFGPCVQQWCPIIGEDLLKGCENDLSLPARRDRLNHPLLLLCLWLVTRRSCLDRMHVVQCALYSTLKQILALLQCRPDVELEVLQIGLLIAVYELGNGLQKPGFQTLAASAAMLRTLELDAKQRQDNDLTATVEWLKASMLMVDRMIPISLTSDTLPLTLQPIDPICITTALRIGPTIPPHSPRPYASSPRKVHIRSAVSIASGHVLTYIHARQHDLKPDKTYDEVDDIINSCIKLLVDKPEPHTWLHCDAIAMAFCSHILLQQAQMRFLSTVATDYQQADYTKAHLALKYSRRMAWDMVRVAIQKIQSEAEIAHLPFAGLCCVLRAGLAVLETKEFSGEEIVDRGELDGFGRIVEWFASRWGLGELYLMRTMELSGRRMMEG